MLRYSIVSREGGGLLLGEVGLACRMQEELSVRRRLREFEFRLGCEVRTDACLPKWSGSVTHGTPAIHQARHPGSLTSTQHCQELGHIRQPPHLRT